MAKENFVLENNIRTKREKQGWSQQELADRAGLSRTGVSAIESGRLIPSTAAALTLAAAFRCQVEELFVLAGNEAVHWAWPPQQEPVRYWRAMVGSKQLLYPVEVNALGRVPHDGVWRDGRCHDHQFADPVRTLVVASCDPAIGILAYEYSRQTPFRMVVLQRSSRAALELLAAGLIHAAGIHLCAANDSGGNRRAAAKVIDREFHLVRIADWEEGLALSPGLAQLGAAAILKADLSWVAREQGSGARQVLDELHTGAFTPTIHANNHAGVAQSIHNGFAQAGVSLRLVCAEENLDFISIRKEAYEFCILDSAIEDPRVAALIEVIRSASYRHVLAELPGYECHKTGELSGVTQD
ncbi:MAG: substrate-binding domain-containing protein [Desulfuromonas sp.]|nr:substrate-binding domain-containing protein [Desulfuromonas sp.]